MYTIISIIVLILSWFLFKRVAGSMKLTQLNMISWIFYYALIAQSFIPAVLVINGWADDHGTIATVSKDARFYGWLAVQYTMIAMPLGMLLVNIMYKYKSNSRLFLSYVHSPITPLISPKDSFIKYPLYVLYLISLFSVAYVVILSPNIPIFEVFQGMDAQALAGFRQEAYRMFQGSDFIKNFLGTLLTPILSYIAYSYWCLTKSKKDLMLFMMMFVLSIFIVAFNLEKSALANYALGFMFLNVLIKGGIKKRTLYLFILAIMLIIIVSYIFIARILDVKDLYLLIGQRIFLEQATGTYLAFDYFPEVHTFIGISSLTKIVSFILGMEYSDNAAKIIMTIHNPEGVKLGITGVMNSLFIQEAWANYGLVGVIIAPWYVGMVVQVIFMFFLKSRKVPIMLGLFAYLSYTMPITAAFNDFLFNPFWIFLSFVFVSVYIAASFFKRLLKNRNRSTADCSLSDAT